MTNIMLLSIQHCFRSTQNMDKLYLIPLIINDKRLIVNTTLAEHLTNLSLEVVFQRRAQQPITIKKTFIKNGSTKTSG